MPNDMTIMARAKNRVAMALQRLSGVRSRLASQDASISRLEAQIGTTAAAAVTQSVSVKNLEERLAVVEGRQAVLASIDTVSLHVQSQGEEVRRLAELFESNVARIFTVESDLHSQRVVATTNIEHEQSLARLLTAQKELTAHRDALLNERDRLLVDLQQAQKQKGLSTDSSQVHARRLPFPLGALIGGTVPKIHVVDIGAQNLTQEEHIYQPLVAAGAAVVTGFEPLEDAAAERSAGDPGVKMLNHFVGDGGVHRFHINQYDPTSSLLPANLAFLDRFESLSTMCTPVQEMEVTTTRLDDIPEAAGCDFLKIDVQGAELDIIKSAANVLAETVAIHCEVEFSHVYVDQPLFGDIDSHLRAAGFELIDIINTGYSTVKGLPRPIARSRLLWGEAVYFRTPESIARLGPEKIAKAAYIAHVNYGMYDVAASLLGLIDRQGDTGYSTTYGYEMSAGA